MKAICHGLDLSDAVAKVLKATATNAANPIFECVKIKAEKDSLVLTGTDSELSIEKRIRADVMIEGEAVVQGRFFGEFVKTLSNEQVEINIAKNKQLKISFADGEADFSCYNLSEFPKIAEVDGAESMVIAKKDLRDLINKIVFSVSTDKARPNLQGVFFEIEKGELTGVALDGYRMAQCVKKLKSSSCETSLLVSARSLSEIRNMLDANDEPVCLHMTKNYLLVDLDHTKIVSRLINSDFINYRQIIPKSFESVVTVNKKSMEAVIDRACLVARNDKNNLVKLDIYNKRMEVSSATTLSSANEKVDIALDGKDITIAFNAKYLEDILHALNDDFIHIKFNTETSPCVITGQDAKGDYLYLVLPIRIN